MAMNSKLPATNKVNAEEIAERVQDYFARIQTERDALQNQVELLSRQNADVEKTLAVSDSKREKAEADRDLYKAQRDDALQKLVALTTLWGTVRTTVSQGEALVAQTVSVLKQPRNGASRDPLDDGIAKIASAFSPQTQPTDAAA
jgi:chromosome segregation ATPase